MQGRYWEKGKKPECRILTEGKGHQFDRKPEHTLRKSVRRFSQDTAVSLSSERTTTDFLKQTVTS